MKFRTGHGSIYGRPEDCTPEAVERRWKRIEAKVLKNKKHKSKKKKKAR
jgi:hypothetical protein